MTITPKPRAHLVERAIEALGMTGRLEHPAPNPGAPAQAAAASIATAPPAREAALAGEAAGSDTTTLHLATSEHVAPPPPPATDNVQTSPAAIKVSAAVLKSAGLVAAAAGTVRSRLSEEVNIVHHQVLRTVRKTPTADGRCGRIVLVTSARPNEGKTFTALNLAASIAAGGRSPVVLVDADGKRGSLSSLLGLAEAQGLRLLVADPKMRAASLLVPTAQGRLSVLPFGVQEPGEPELPPGEMLAAAILRMALALPEHLIVIDSPPCLSTSDPSSLAVIAGQVLLVIQAERTQQSEVEAALDMVDACPTLQLMLNRTRLTTSSSFGAYGDYDVYGAYGARPTS